MIHVVQPTFEMTPGFKLSQNYIVAYGLQGEFTTIHPGLYDQHSAFVIKPTEVSYNVDLDMNNDIFMISVMLVTID